MTTINAYQVKDMLLHVASEIISQKPLLTEIDSAIGDGDHGIGMERGFKNAQDKLLAAETADVFSLFSIAGKAMLMSMGGASGVIFGTMFLAGAKGHPPQAEICVKDLYEMFHTALVEIQRRGGATIGDKTMVDAFAPAISALGENCHCDFLAALSAAEYAAKSGMKRTKELEARFGRAKTQRSTIGYQDAGATSVWIIFRAMREFVQSIA